MGDGKFFKVLAHNDTGQATGHQGGIVIPKDISVFFPLIVFQENAAQPTADVLIAEAVESFEWELRDATGRMLQQSSVFNIRHRIDLSRYAAGSYVLIATTQRGGTRSFMLVKQ